MKNSYIISSTQYGMLGESLEVMYRFLLGESLEASYQSACRFNEKLIQQQQNTVLYLFQSLFQALANLYGKSEDPLTLTGVFMNEADAIQKAHHDNNMIGLAVIYVAKAMVAYTLNEYEVAEEYARRSINLKHAMNMSATMVYLQIFIEGMSGLGVGKPDIRRAKTCIRKLKNYARTAPTVLTGRIALLEAEVAAAKRHHDLALEKFEIAIAVAQRNGIVSDHAMACERASVFMTRCGRLNEAAQYLSEALDLYAAWGCDLKVQKIKKMLAATSAK
jgi:hypothetical protein